MENRERKVDFPEYRNIWLQNSGCTRSASEDRFWLIGRAGHFVAVDELGVIDPANNAPDHVEIAEYVLSRKSQGANFHSEFLAIERRS